MLAPGVRVEGCAHCAHGTTGKRRTLSQFLESPEEERPVVLLHASGFDAWPRFPRPLPFPMSSASSPTLVSAVALLHLRCDVRPESQQLPPACRSRHSSGLAILTMRDAPMTRTTLLRPALCASSRRASNSSAHFSWAP